MGHEMAAPNPWMILPFAALLLTIAFGPLSFPGWWGRHYPKVAYALGAIVVLYYAFGLRAYDRLLHVGYEYISFIVLIGALYVVAGGIHITVKGESTPLENVLFLLVGALIANVLGTTGASMLLIRPWIRMNKYRITAHHIVFFIFIVSNVGGCLTPIGDPPLFLGYLKGIPFWWVAEFCWPMWALAVCSLLAIFYLVDYANYLRAPKAIRRQVAEPPDVWKFEGGYNVLFLLVILVAVFLEHPLFLREILMGGAALASYFVTRDSIHKANDFNLHPIQEVAILFIGIFATMIPALDWLQTNAASFGAPSPALFYWATGTLSSFLDNAPTYLSFLTAIFGLFISPEVVQEIQGLIASGADFSTVTGAHAENIRQTFAVLQKYHSEALAAKTLTVEQIEIAFILGSVKVSAFLQAVSVGAVFFGAATYIGNGPNFMVKAIADQQRVHVPTFLGYLFKYSAPFLLPVLTLVWFVFFR